MPRLAAPLFLFALVFLLSAQTLAQAPDDLAALLAKPVSPGTLALLVPHGADPRVQERWVAALKSESADARLTAARMLAVAGKPDAAPALRTALEAESDAGAALEMARALLRVDGEADAVVLAAAARLDASSLLVELGRARGPQAVRHIPAVRERAPASLGSFLGAVFAADPGAVNPLAQSALNTPDEEMWREILAVPAAREALNEAVMRAALESPSPRIRADAWWHLASEASVPGSSGFWWAERARAGDPQVAGLAAEDAFGLELAARAADKAFVTHRGFVERLRGKDLGSLPPIAASTLTRLARFLTDEEWRALSLFQSGDEKRQRPSPPNPAAAVPERAAYDAVRTVDDIPPAIVSGVLDVTRCKGRNGVMAGAVVDYAPDGRPTTLSWDLGPDCEQAVRALVLASLLPIDRAETPVRRHMLILPVSDRYFECLASSPPVNLGQQTARVGVSRTRGGVTPPRKTTDMRPHYPEKAKAEGVEGIVILEAQIGPTGCVRRVRVLHQRDTRLDLAALYAVSHWGFTPTRLGGKPVPVEMTVTVQFSLR